MNNSKILFLSTLLIFLINSCRFFGSDQTYYESNFDGKFKTDRKAWCENYPICLQYIKNIDVKPFNDDTGKTCHDKYLSLEDQSKCVGYSFLLLQMCLELLVDPRTKIKYSHIDYHCGEYYKENFP